MTLLSLEVQIMKLMLSTFSRMVSEINECMIFKIFFVSVYRLEDSCWFALGECCIEMKPQKQESVVFMLTF